MIISHFYTTLETDARNFGFSSRSKTEKKLVPNPVARVNKGNFLDNDNWPYLWVM
jgi:hypothetical protein